MVAKYCDRCCFLNCSSSGIEKSFRADDGATTMGLAKLIESFQAWRSNSFLTQPCNSSDKTGFLLGSPYPVLNILESSVIVREEALQADL